MAGSWRDRFSGGLADGLADAHGGAGQAELGAQDLATRSVLPMVAARRPAAEGLGLAAGLVVVLALGGLTFWGLSSARQGSGRQGSAQVGPQQVGPQAGQQAGGGPAGAALAVAAPTGVAPALPPSQIGGFPAGSSPIIGAAPTSFVAPVAANRYGAPALVYDAGAGAPVASAAPLAPAAPPASGVAPQPSDEFSRRFGGVGGGAATASASFNPATTIAQGSLIPAVLETAINTDLPGYVRAVVSADVRSFDGSAVLVPRSSRLVGEYKSGLQAGQKRAYVIWTRLIRPDGVSVALNSPAVGFGGETGLGGRVNNHFFERFGSAMLLSVLGNLGNVVGSNSATIVLGGGQSAAAAAIGQTGQIAPTVQVRQGLPIRVFTARDLDFSKAPPP